MSSLSATEETPQPLRDLLDPAIEEPARTYDMGTERRKGNRYSRRLSGVLRFADQVHPITCQDVSYGGLRVLAPTNVRIDPGERVLVNLRQGTRLCQDECTVVHSEHKGYAIAIHLRF